jgi:hypothetical protein
VPELLPLELGGSAEEPPLAPDEPLDPELPPIPDEPVLPPELGGSAAEPLPPDELPPMPLDPDDPELPGEADELPPYDEPVPLELEPVPEVELFFLWCFFFAFVEPVVPLDSSLVELPLPDIVPDEPVLEPLVP